MKQDIYSYVQNEITNYQTVPVKLTDSYEWNMFEHLEHCFNMRESQFWSGGNKDYSRVYKNIVTESINLKKATLDIDDSDIKLFAVSAKDHWKSFVARKFYDNWSYKDTLGIVWNDMIESLVDYGGALIQNTKKKGDLSLEVVQLEKIAFCDQTDILSGPIGIKHELSIDQIKEKEGIWENIDEVILQAKQYKKGSKGEQIKTPSKYIEVIEVRGVLPESFLDEDKEDTAYSRQVHYITFYQDSNGDKQGITLYSNTEAANPFRMLITDPVFGRALGKGGIEELFHPQIWTNWSLAKKKDMLSQASHILYKTTDKSLGVRNITNNLKNGNILKLAENTDIGRVNNSPDNMSAFDNFESQMADNGQRISASYDSATGAESKSGMPFRLGALLNEQAQKPIKKKRQKIGLFLEVLHKKDIIPFLQQEMNKEVEFNANLSGEEKLEIIGKKSEYNTFDKVKRDVLLGKTVGDTKRIKETEIKKLQKEKNFFFSIPKNFFKNVPLDVKVQVVGEKYNTQIMVEKLSSVFQMALANAPMIAQNAGLQKAFNQILELSGLSGMDIDFSQPPPTQPTTNDGAELQSGREELTNKIK